ncbi:hypothetical protein DMP23_30620 [Amycolatopsis sp. A1MSW2902]
MFGASASEVGLFARYVRYLFVIESRELWPLLADGAARTGTKRHTPLRGRGCQEPSADDGEEPRDNLDLGE